MSWTSGSKPQELFSSHHPSCSLLTLYSATNVAHREHISPPSLSRGYLSVFLPTLRYLRLHSIFLGGLVQTVPYSVCCQVTRSTQISTTTTDQSSPNSPEVRGTHR